MTNAFLTNGFCRSQLGESRSSFASSLVWAHLLARGTNGPTTEQAANSKFRGSFDLTGKLWMKTKSLNMWLLL